jgi:hypothetical protein
MTNRSRRRFLTSAVAITSLGMLSGCSDILGSTETNTPETSSKTPDSTTAVTETIATTVETVTAPDIDGIIQNILHPKDRSSLTPVRI